MVKKEKSFLVVQLPLEINVLRYAVVNISHFKNVSVPPTWLSMFLCNTDAGRQDAADDDAATAVWPVCPLTEDWGEQKKKRWNIFYIYFLLSSPMAGEFSFCVCAFFFVQFSFSCTKKQHFVCVAIMALACTNTNTFRHTHIKRHLFTILPHSIFCSLLKFNKKDSGCVCFLFFWCYLLNDRTFS